jgi:hypothetical protein
MRELSPLGRSETAEECGSAETSSHKIENVTARRWAWISVLAVSILCWLLIIAALFAAGAFGKCRTSACWKRVHDKRALAWLKRERPAVYWWRGMHPDWKAWARSTGSCESGNRAHIATGNGFYGAFQFVPSTWYSAQRYAPPALRTRRMAHTVRWEHQAVVAISLAQMEGTQHWPVCGR